MSLTASKEHIICQKFHCHLTELKCFCSFAEAIHLYSLLLQCLYCFLCWGVCIRSKTQEPQYLWDFEGTKVEFPSEVSYLRPKESNSIFIFIFMENQKLYIERVPLPEGRLRKKGFIKKLLSGKASLKPQAHHTLGLVMSTVLK